MTLRAFQLKEAALKAERREIMKGLSLDEIYESAEYWRVANQLKELHAQAVAEGLIKEEEKPEAVSPDVKAKQAAAMREARVQFERQQMKTDDTIDFY